MIYTIERVDMDNEDIRHEINILDVECFPEDDICDKTGDWWVVRHKGDVVAYAGLKQSEHYEKTGYLCRVGVSVAHRGQAIQFKLIQARVNHARSLGWHWLVTDTYDNPVCCNNLITAQFRMYSPRKPWGTKHSNYWTRPL